MIRSISASALLFVLSLLMTSCGDSMSPSAPDSTPLSKAITRHRDISWVVEDCCGNLVRFTGTLNYTLARNVDEAGGYHVSINSTIAGMKGTLPDGRQIVYNGPQHTSINMPASGGSTEHFSYTYNFRVQGGDDDCSGRITISGRYVVDANGEVQVEDLTVTNSCDDYDYSL